MKRIVLYTLLSFLYITSFAQTATTSFEVDGIKVIWKPTTKDIIHVSMYYRGGVANYPAGKAGIENAALAAATECGTQKFNKDAFKDKADAFGILIGGSSSYDFGNISMNCISKYFNEGWSLFSDAITHPTFDEKEYGLLKERLVSGLKEREANPDDRVEQMALTSAFSGTPYAINPEGEDSTLSKISASDLKNYYNSILNKKRMFLVVVGKISKEDLISKIKASFASLPSKAYSPVLYKVPQFTTGIVSEERQLATNYIMGLFNAEKMNSEEYVPYRLGISLFSTRLFKEIRTKRNLSYAPYAYSATHLMPYGLMYVSTTDPKASVEVMVNELKKIKSQGFSADELQKAKSSFITSNYMKEESSSAIASSLGNAEVMGNWKLAEELPAKVTQTSLAQLQAAFKNVTGIKWSYLGDTKLLAEASAVFNISLSK
ncbi:M16 family metallopeptidase [Rubrolithibacter danxiaensis]|uniref:M16 family metallopeptidase n=1 Tax=Rubrolithibacter danxiaensis TaxID=3390805 RepID=UPI003BF82417